MEDHALGRTVQSEYDLAERPVQATHRDAAGIFYRTTLHYDAQNRLDSFKENVGENLYTTTYAYDKDSRTTQVAYGSEKVDYVYDELGRLSTRTTTNGVSYPTAYAYLPGAAENSTTSLVSQITHGSGDNALTYAYTYDSRGNITTETRNGLTTTYHYDNLGQLVRVDDPHESATWVYTYDLGGNILSKAKYALNDLTSTPEATSFTYGDTNWKDKLTAVNGVAITYDAIGNPLSDGEWNYEWQAGRQLKKMSKDGVTIEFAYDHNGLRTQKKVTENGVETITNYTLHGKLITHLTQGNNTLHFYYDANSRPSMVNFNGTIYTYIHNLQGDIIAIIDNAGTAVVEYSYDAWGRIIATTGSKSATLGKINPFRYRGYVYDGETGLYYLRSRYYAPIQSRFVSSDSIFDQNSMFGSNLYCYCGNESINRIDFDGFRYRSIEMLPQDAIYFHKEIYIEDLGCGYTAKHTAEHYFIPIGILDTVRTEQDLEGLAYVRTIKKGAGAVAEAIVLRLGKKYLLTAIAANIVIPFMIGVDYYTDFMEDFYREQFKDARNKALERGTGIVYTKYTVHAPGSIPVESYHFTEWTDFVKRRRRNVPSPNNNYYKHGSTRCLY